MNGGVIRSFESESKQSVLLEYCKQNSFLPGLWGLIFSTITERLLYIFFGLGLHINISEGEPISSKHSIASLIDGQTDLFFDKPGLRKNLPSIDLHHIEVEIEHQIIRFEKIFGTSPIRADGHQHCHVLPGIIRKSDFILLWT